MKLRMSVTADPCSLSAERGPTAIGSSRRSRALVSQCTRSAQYPFIRWLLASLTRPPGRPDERRSHDVGTILTPSLSLRPRRTRADGRGPTRRPLGRQRRPASAGSGDGPGIGGDGRDGAVAPSSFRPPPPSPRPLGPSPPSSWALGSPSPPLGSPPPSPRPLGASPPRGPSSPLVGERAYRLGPDEADSLVRPLLVAERLLSALRETPEVFSRAVPPRARTHPVRPYRSDRRSAGPTRPARRSPRPPHGPSRSDRPSPADRRAEPGR